MPRVVRMSGTDSFGRLLACVTVAAALASCVRYETVAINELDYPGACPKDSVALATAVAETTFAVSDAAGALVGVVIRQGNGAPLPGAIVYALKPDTLRTQSDSLGRFRVPDVKVGAPLGLDVRQLGYARVSAAIRVPPAGRGVRISLRPATLDGPCSGFALILERRRKPWWKFW